MSNYKVIASLFNKIERSRKNQFISLALFSLFTSIFEVFSIGLVFPFISILFNLQNFKSKFPFIQDYFSSDYEIINGISFIFIVVIILTGLFRYLLLIFHIRFSQNLGIEIGLKMLNNFLDTDYIDFIQTNNSKRVSALTLKLNQVVNQIVLALLRIIYTSLFILIITIVFLIYMPGSILYIFTVIFVLYFLINKIFSKHIIFHGESINERSNAIIKILNESFNAIKDVIVFNLKDSLINVYKQTEVELRNSINKLRIIGMFPKYLIESLGIVCIVIIAYNNVNNANNDILPIIGFLLLGLQRILPLAQELHHSITELKGGVAVAYEVDKYLVSNDKKINEIKTNNIQRIYFQSLELKGLSYSYNSRNKILTDFNITISRGDIVGIFGESGSGKTTLLDILLGLLYVDVGKFYVNGIEFNQIRAEWNNSISFVSQNIFLTDKTIAENITLKEKLEESDEIKLQQLLELCEMSSLLQSLPNGIDSYVGENGAFLSGGQKQRIAIVRALFQEPEVLILDEFTSALDKSTEEKVFLNIINWGKKNKITIIYVTHEQDMLRQANIKVNLS